MMHICRRMMHYMYLSYSLRGIVCGRYVSPTRVVCELLRVVRKRDVDSEIDA